MSEFRQDRTTGRWVIIAPERGKRPGRESPVGAGAGGPVPRYDPSCPFCPGNEHLLPGIIAEMPGDGPNAWLTRIVPNKYPALDPQNGPAGPPPEEGDTLPGFGFHEVIVETAAHDGDLTTLSDHGLMAIARTYRKRTAELAANPAIAAVLIFRNHGGGGGASLAHPHSQLIATPLVPPRLAEMASWGHAQYQKHERCPTCEQVAFELEDGDRVIEATDRFLVVVPFAAASPFETWVLPRRHHGSLTRTGDEEIEELGVLLGRTVERLAVALDRPSYNYAIESGPVAHDELPYLHWRLRIVPDVVTPGGFEIGGGLPINPSSPEGDARTLRAAVIAAPDSGAP